MAPPTRYATRYTASFSISILASLLFTFPLATNILRVSKGVIVTIVVSAFDKFDKRRRIDHLEHMLICNTHARMHARSHARTHTKQSIILINFVFFVQIGYTSLSSDCSTITRCAECTTCTRPVGRLYTENYECASGSQCQLVGGEPACVGQYHSCPITLLRVSITFCSYSFIPENMLELHTDEIYNELLKPMIDMCNTIATLR